MACPLATSWAQLEPANEAGVSLGHFHTIVRDVEANKKFWTTLGGKALKIDGTDVVKFAGFFVFISEGTPSGGSYGSVVNHIALLVPNHEEAVASWAVAGLTAELGKSAFATTSIGWAYTPD